MDKLNIGDKFIDKQGRIHVVQDIKSNVIGIFSVFDVVYYNRKGEAFSKDDIEIVD